MAWLLCLVVIVSLADLALTLIFLRSIGMSEGNPIARWVMGANCPWVLVLFKIVLVGFACTVLWRTRHSRAAKLGAGVGCLVMLWLCLRWVGYTEQVSSVVMANPEITQTSTWVRFN
jgi:hypothetical protein